MSIEIAQLPIIYTVTSQISPRKDWTYIYLIELIILLCDNKIYNLSIKLPLYTFNSSIVILILFNKPTHRPRHRHS